LVKAAAAFLDNTGTREDLDLAQAMFNIDRQRIKHVDKIENAAAAKAPWVPVVNATEATSADVVSAIDRMSARTTEALAEIVVIFEDGTANMLSELRALSRVSPSSDSLAICRLTLDEAIRTANNIPHSPRQVSPPPPPTTANPSNDETELESGGTAVAQEIPIVEDPRDGDYEDE
jgi:hypothetical protein